MALVKARTNNPFIPWQILGSGVLGQLFCCLREGGWGCMNRQVSPSYCPARVQDPKARPESRLGDWRPKGREHLSILETGMVFQQLGSLACRRCSSIPSIEHCIRNNPEFRAALNTKLRVALVLAAKGQMSFLLIPTEEHPRPV